MTLMEILSASLEQVGRTPDAQTIEAHRDRFTHLANDAVIDLAMACKLRRTDAANVENGTLDLSQLPYSCKKVISVKKDGAPVAFSRGGGSEQITVAANGAVQVEYRCVPKPLSSDTDEPGIPESLHGLIVLYVLTRELMVNDDAASRRAVMLWQLYQDGKRQAVKDMGEPENYVIFGQYD